MTPTHSILLSAVASAGLIASAAFAQPVLEGGKRFTTELTGEAEISNTTGLPNAGDLQATGTAKITVNPGQRRVCWEITTGNFSTGTTSIVGAHIHEAPAGSNGGIVVHLTAAINTTTTGCADVTRALADEIRKSPQNFYVNVHTNLFTAGAIRGQLG
jgi:hypothetical protein